MAEDLISEPEDAARTMRKAAIDADNGEDLVTTDMLTDRLSFHEKPSWMLRTTISA